MTEHGAGETSVKKVVVVGGVAAGMSVAAKAKRVDPKLEVTVFEKSGYISYGACGMPYVIGGDVASLDALIARTPQEMAEKGVTVKVRHEVTNVDPEAKTVQVKNLESGAAHTAPYDALVLATGAVPVRPELPGIDLGGVHVLRLIEDAAAIRETIRSGAKNAAIVGGSYIGLELAEALVKAGLSVRVIEQQGELLSNFGPLPAKLALGEVRQQGVRVHLETEVTALAGDSRVREVVTNAGRFPAELVVVAVGAQPNNALAKALSLALGPAGAVLTDDRLRTSREGVYAVGDVTAVHHLVTGKPAWIPLGDTANKQGRTLGSLLGGKEARFKGVVGTAATKVFDRAFATTGLTLKAAQDAGFSAASHDVETTDHAGYYPDKRPLSVTLVWEKGSSRLLGAQLVGYGDAVKRVDVLAAVLFQAGTVQDLADLDLAYAPPFSGVWDPLLVAANVALGK
jgi:NADPH-dependent 2,4-dienoyl-CoA reductase/sulfur reductase-like enzyme